MLAQSAPSLPVDDRAPEAAVLDAAIEAAVEQLASRHIATGAWPGDYGGPMFLLPLYVATCYGTGATIDAATREQMARYLRSTQNEEGAWGLHCEGAGHVFTTALAYVALRLLDEEPGTASMLRARRWMSAHGGPTQAASWGKFVLALLNLYDYDGLNPVPPEVWLLPRSAPVHPSRLWCHARMVYLPMSYLYGKRVQAPLDARLRSIRRELYPQGYDKVDWVRARDSVSATDSYTPVSPLMKRANRALLAYEGRALAPLRRRALAEVVRQVGFEDVNTQYVCLGPVNKLYHLWLWHTEQPGGAAYQRHLAQLPEYLYQAADGVKMQGYHSSQLWDTTFAAQAMLAAGAGPEHASVLNGAAEFIAASQVVADMPHTPEAYRDPCLGGWGFSDRRNGWIVSDCTAQGLMASLELQQRVAAPLSRLRLNQAVDRILCMQTDSGGWASYEPPRGGAWLEQLNPSNCFGKIMIDYCYVECTASCVEALAQFRGRYPDVRREDIDGAIARGRDYLLLQQRPDGSFEGSWGVCFTYATRFAVLGLRAAGLAVEHEAIRRAAYFLTSKQLGDGGWGELPESNRRGDYVTSATGQPVQTAWALLALVAAGRQETDAVRRGTAFLLQTQRPEGGWDHGHITGMFNKTCAIHYDNYSSYFPLWALAKVRG